MFIFLITKLTKKPLNKINKEPDLVISKNVSDP